MIVDFTPEAETDLEAISDYIARENPERALTFIQEVRDRCAALSDFPERFPLVARYERRRVRHVTHGKYLIFYRVDPDAVLILHILHGARDYRPLLFPK